MTPDYIVDAHHHLWDLKACEHTWLAEQGVVRFFGDPAPIQKNYHAIDFRTDFGSLPVRKSVHIQCGVAHHASVQETMWLSQQADLHGLPNAIIAFADLTSADLSRTLDQHARSSALRGIRQIIGRSADEDRKSGTTALLSDPAFLAGLKELEARNLSFDIQLTPPLISAVADLFGKVPELNSALCHCGSRSDPSRAGSQEWVAGLKALARLPNLICKVSGFGMFDHNWTPASIRSDVLTVIDIFGPQRVAFGSNFPVDKLYADYEAVFGAYLEITENFSKDERQQMFAGTAERFYRI